MLSSANFTLSPPNDPPLSDEQFYALCAANRDLRIERNSNGDIVIMAPAGGETSRRNACITFQLWRWNQRTKLGVAFDSSGGFRLPNGADRAPDAAWIPLAWWEGLSAVERERFLPLSPLLAIELRSRTDRIGDLREKMGEYVENGTELGWLIDPLERCVEVFRPGGAVAVLANPGSVSADPVLPGFVLELGDIF